MPDQAPLSLPPVTSQSLSDWLTPLNLHSTSKCPLPGSPSALLAPLIAASASPHSPAQRAADLHLLLTELANKHPRRPAFAAELVSGLLTHAAAQIFLSISPSPPAASAQIIETVQELLALPGAGLDMRARAHVAVRCAAIWCWHPDPMIAKGHLASLPESSRSAAVAYAVTSPIPIVRALSSAAANFPSSQAPQSPDLFIQSALRFADDLQGNDVGYILNTLKKKSHFAVIDLLCAALAGRQKPLEPTADMYKSLVISASTDLFRHAGAWGQQQLQDLWSTPPDLWSAVWSVSSPFTAWFRSQECTLAAAAVVYGHSFAQKLMDQRPDVAKEDLVWGQVFLNYAGGFDHDDIKDALHHKAEDAIHRMQSGGHQIPLNRLFHKYLSEDAEEHFNLTSDIISECITLLLPFVSPSVLLHMAQHNTFLQSLPHVQSLTTQKAITDSVSVSPSAPAKQSKM